MRHQNTAEIAAVLFSSYFNARGVSSIPKSFFLTLNAFKQQQVTYYLSFSAEPLAFFILILGVLCVYFCYGYIHYAVTFYL